jgi:hypothetical protein
VRGGIKFGEDMRLISWIFLILKISLAKAFLRKSGVIGIKKISNSFRKTNNFFSIKPSTLSSGSVYEYLFVVVLFLKCMLLLAVY